MASQKELELFKALGVDIIPQVPVLSMYSFAVEKVFLKNMSGPAVDSLRRCIQARNSCGVYRMTPEWDALIQLEEDGEPERTQMKYTVQLISTALVSTKVEIEASSQKEADKKAKEVADAGDVLWMYGGLLEDGSIEVVQTTLMEG